MDMITNKPNLQDSESVKRIGIILYPSFDSLDVIGAHQVFHYACRFRKGSEVLLIGPGESDMLLPEMEPYREATAKRLVNSGEGLQLSMDLTYEEYLVGGDEYALDVVYVSGAMKTHLPLYFAETRRENSFFQLLEKAQGEAEIIASVCTGALLLGASGLLAGKRVTTHWESTSLLRQFPEVTVVDGYPRFVVDQQIITGGGISSTIDEALAIVIMIFDRDTAEKVQLIMQYNPSPPVQSGDPDSANTKVMLDISRQLKGENKPRTTDKNDMTFLHYLEHQCIP